MAQISITLNQEEILRDVWTVRERPLTEEHTFLMVDNMYFHVACLRKVSRIFLNVSPHI